MPKLSKPDKKAKVSQNEARRRKEVALARLREMAADQMQGKLIDRMTVESEWFGNARLIRDGMMNIPDRVASLLASVIDAKEVHRLLDVEIRKALNSVADAIASKGGVPSA